MLTGVVLILAVLLVVPEAGQARYVEGQLMTAVDVQRVPGVLIVNFKPDVLPASAKTASRGGSFGIPSVDALNARWDLKAHRPLFPGVKVQSTPLNQTDLRGFMVFEFEAQTDLDDAASEYLADPNVESVEFDFYAQIMRTPNDTYYSNMWALNDPQDNDMDAPEAWEKSVGGPTIILAGTDTGVLYTHPDLIDNIWVNPGEDLDGDGEVFDPDDMNDWDDDGNGYEDDLIGYDFVVSGSAVWPGEDGSVKDNDPRDFHGHGTHTAGTFAATTNNGVGVSGIAGGFGPGTEPGCKIMCLRIAYSFNDGGYENGRTQMSYAAEAFRYAADMGARAINYSLGSSGGGGIEAATTYAINAGVVISASAGNSNNSSFGYLQSRSDVLCVASTTSQDIKSSFSNYGTAVDVSAPGSSIRSTVSNHYSPSYTTWGGTSMAAPQVVGLVGLILSANPALTRQEVFDRIVDNTDNIDALNPTYAGKLGSGRINANNCLQSLASADFTAAPQIGNAPLNVQFSDVSPTPATAWDWDFGDGAVAFVQNPQHTYAPGLYDVSLTIDSDIGDGSITQLAYVAALAETVIVADMDAFLGQPVVVELRAVNNLPVDTIVLPVIASNIPAYAWLDSIVTTGCLTEDFQMQVLFDNRFGGQMAMRLTAEDPVPPLATGEGLIAKAYFRIKTTAPIGGSIDVSMGTLSSYDFEFSAKSISYVPDLQAGTLGITAQIGDMNLDLQIDALDLSALIDVLYAGAPLPTPPELADTNCDGQPDALDLAVMIDHLFAGGAAPCE
jgi:subtilisin family serine protease